MPVRPAALADATAIATLLGDLGYPSTAEAIPSRLAALQSDARALVIVAERGGDVVGLATGHTHASIHCDEEVAWLTSLVVTPNARRRGAGRALVRAVERWAKSRGCVRLAVVTALHRADAHAFYERIGFELTGRRYAKILESS